MKYAKEGQDLAAMALLGKNGYFLDIGMGVCDDGNNSLRLEEAGWNGLMFDLSSENVSIANQKRRNKAIQCDVTTFSFEDCLLENSAPFLIDYISMDTDAANTELVTRFPFDKYEFCFLTFEHDFYNTGWERKRACEKALAKYPKYVRIVDNCLVNGLAWEDWWINTDYVSSSFRFSNASWQQVIQKLQRESNRI